MKDLLIKLSVFLQTAMGSEEGQDLIEYALIVALVAFAATAGMSALATSINTAFTNVGTKLNDYITT